MHNLYSGNYKTLLKEIKEDLEKWKYSRKMEILPCSWIERLNTVNMAISRVICRINTIPRKSSADLFSEITNRF